MRDLPTATNTQIHSSSRSRPAPGHPELERDQAQERHRTAFCAKPSAGSAGVGRQRRARPQWGRRKPRRIPVRQGPALHGWTRGQRREGEPQLKALSLGSSGRRIAHQALTRSPKASLRHRVPDCAVRSKSTMHARAMTGRSDPRDTRTFTQGSKRRRYLLDRQSKSMCDSSRTWWGW